MSKKDWKDPAVDKSRKICECTNNYRYLGESYMQVCNESQLVTECDG